jgi:hypothetical protein
MGGIPGIFEVFRLQWRAGAVAVVEREPHAADLVVIPAAWAAANRNSATDSHGYELSTLIIRDRVIDVSIMPEVPRTNTNLPCIAIAEHMAVHLTR